MRGAAMLIGLSVSLCACQSEPDFDERYTDAEKAIQQRAAEIDEDLQGVNRGDMASEPAENQPNSAEQ